MDLRRLSRYLVIVSVIAGLVAGCQTTNPYSGQQQTSRTTIGAGIGALAGAAIGMLTGGDARQHRKNALIGAGVGALAGGATGNYMDRQQAKLRDQLQGTGVQVVRKGDDITLVMPGNITFQTNSADLKPDFYQVLNSVAVVVKEYNKTILEVAGHTDNTGSAQYNQSLSERRASSVARYLESQGVTSQRIITVGAGETHPIASNDTPDGRQANRRVELTLEPVTATNGAGSAG
jgi:outer membrane protein OmpA-like peptidoglycan-associated protein